MFVYTKYTQQFDIGYIKYILRNNMEYVY